MDPLTIFHVLSSAHALSRFVLNGGMAKAVGDLHINAAKEAFDRVAFADDKPAQVRAALTILQVAAAANKPEEAVILVGKEFTKQHRRASILKAAIICAEFLGDKGLGDRLLIELDENEKQIISSLERLPKVPEPYQKPANIAFSVASMVASVVLPPLMVLGIGVAVVNNIQEDPKDPFFGDISHDEFKQKIMALRHS